MINKSVLAQAPFSVSISVVGVTIITLFTVIEPESSAGLDFWSRLLYWTTQVSISLIGILLASHLIRRLATAFKSDLVLIIATGILACIVVSPAFIFIEGLFPLLDRVPDSALDDFAETGVAPALIVQILETMPALVTVWVLVNLPILLKSTFIESNKPDPSLNDEPVPVVKKSTNTNNLQRLEKASFTQKLPESIGDKIMYVSSDLHYLKVTTELGSALVLGSISKFSEAFKEEGFQVHRSHWVNKTYVTRVLVSWGSCLLHNARQNTHPHIQK